MNFERVRKIADAVLYEGYVLYPYRPSSTKNQFRWQFGVVAPHGCSGETSEMQTECLIEVSGEAVLDLSVRFLQVTEGADLTQRRGDAEEKRWEHGIEREISLEGIPLKDLLGGERVEPFQIGDAISGALRVSAEQTGSLVKLRVLIQNLGDWKGGEDRSGFIRNSLVGAHTLLGVRGGHFISLIDPPAEAKAAAAGCSNSHTFPVLAGNPGERDIMLSSPIILYDYPTVAPESPGDFCDGTEIDELLTLRIMTLTDEEKREACAADERARAIIERSDSIPAEVFERLHGAIRSISPAAERRLAKGDRVRIQPRRRADSMDLFLTGRIARIADIQHDFENRTYVAVVVEDDPGADLHDSYGRYFYFDPDELEPVQKEV